MSLRPSLGRGCASPGASLRERRLGWRACVRAYVIDATGTSSATRIDRAALSRRFVTVQMDMADSQNVLGRIKEILVTSTGVIGEGRPLIGRSRHTRLKPKGPAIEHRVANGTLGSRSRAQNPPFTQRTGVGNRGIAAR